MRWRKEGQNGAGQRRLVEETLPERHAGRPPPEMEEPASGRKGRTSQTRKEDLGEAALGAALKLWIKAKSTLGRSRKVLKFLTLGRSFGHKSQGIEKCIFRRDDGEAFEVEKRAHWIWGSSLPRTG